MNANLYVIEDYENEPPSGPKKTNPNKPNLVRRRRIPKGQNEQKIACRKIQPISTNQKKIWTIPKGTIKILVLDKLSISGSC